MKLRKAILTFVLIAVLAISMGSPSIVTAADESGFLAETMANIRARWTQRYIVTEPPIMMNEPYLVMFGQARGDIPYTFEDAVKLTGHSCAATAGAFTIARKALDVLYPGDEIPVRGQIKVWVPGAEDQWNLGVFGEVITFVTGAAPKTGFNGAEFGQVNNVFVRKDKMIYTELPTPTPPPQMVWIFERLDTGKQVSVQFNVSLIQPAVTPEWTEMGKKMALGTATPQEARAYRIYWNSRASFVFENADTLEGLFTVIPLN